MPRVRRSWLALRGLCWEERLVLMRALCLLPLTAVSLRVLGFRRTKAWLIPESAAGRLRTDLPRAQALARIVHGAAQWSPLRADCLPRALVLCRLLAAHDLSADFWIGAGKPEGEFAAHAWVEHDGTVLAEAETPTARFVAFDEPSLRRGA